MIIETRNGICKVCGDAKVEIMNKKTNHILHLSLTICTFGVWIVIWLFLSIDSLNGKQKRCAKCGRKAKVRFWS